MVLHPWGVVDRNVGNDCSFRHRMQLAQTEINKRFVSIASRLSRGLNRSFACQKGIPFFFSILFLQLCFLHFTGQFSGIGTVCTGGNLQMCKVQWLGNILPITHALYSTKFLLRRWTSPQPSVHAGD